jgi:uncharacterized protein YodC (DUF2158 family)
MGKGDPLLVGGNMTESSASRLQKKTQKRQDLANEGIFKVGDIVRLKSGGPSMTVDGYNDYDGDVVCKWFAGDKLQYGTFNPDAVELDIESSSLDELITSKKGR